MEIILLIFVAASALCAVSSLDVQKYHFIYQPKSWYEARNFCRDHYTDLATIDNMDDMNILNDMADLQQMVYSEYSYLAWIGLYNPANQSDVNTWRWSISDPNYYQDEEKEFSNWEAGKPIDYSGQENCGEMNMNGSWNDASCSKTQNAICLQVSGSDVVFVHLETNLNWTEAQSYCREHHTDLASVRNLAENQLANKVIPEERVWIGLFRDSWKWVDANNSSFRYWSKYEPNNNGIEECAAAHFSGSGQWKDWNCDEKKSFFCYSELCGSASHPGLKYFFVGELKNWTEAQSHCREYYSNLAVMENMEDVRILNDMAASLNFTSTAWIGLYDDVSSWRWSVAESDLNQDEENKFTNWFTNEPNNAGGKESCVLMYSDGSWNDDTCSTLQRSVCSDVRGTFVSINTFMTWTEAQSYCRNHHTDLARVRDMTENQKIRTLIPAGRGVWIGLHRPSWMWADGSKSSFMYWRSSEPNGPAESCALANLGNSGQWEDWGCDIQKAFICYDVVCDKAPYPTRKYIIVDELKNWTEARRYCREHHTDLATIRNMEDVKMLNVLAASMGKTSLVWIGLHEDVKSWRWSMSGFYHRENQFRNWAAGEPNNEYGKESCGALRTVGSWYDVPCSQSLKTVCFNVSGTTPTFYYSSTKRTWTEAQSYCREHYTDLARVRHMSDNNVIKDLISKPVWIGLYRDSWKWVDGRNSSYRYWNSVEPDNNGDEECGLANFGNAGKWEHWSCGEKKAFVCYAAPPPKHLVKLKLELPSSQSADDSAVLEDLLEKLQQKLKDDGVKGDIKLSWRKQADGKILQKEKKEN